jgi:peroxiredoxin
MTNRSHARFSNAQLSWFWWLSGALLLAALLFGFVRRRPFAALAAANDLGLPPAAGALGVGQALPDLTLLDHTGHATSFRALRGQPLWLAFFRGAYCAYCREQLQAVGARADEIASAGVQFIAVTPDPPATSARLRRDLGLSFPFLSDQAETAVTALCGGLSHCQLLIDARGIIRWAGWSESWSQGPTLGALLEAVRGLRTD